MVNENYTSSFYLRPEIMHKIDLIIEENKELYHSRSQLINSLLYKFLREKGKVPMEITLNPARDKLKTINSR